MPRVPFALSENFQEHCRSVDALKGYLRRRFGSQLHATTAVHEAILRALEQAIETTEKDFWPRALRRAIDLLRRQGIHDRILDELTHELPQADETDPANEEILREVSRTTRRVADSLPPTEREIWLLLCEGKSYDEIAQQLQKSPGAVKAAVCRARRTARELLANKE